MWTEERGLKTGFYCGRHKWMTTECLIALGSQAIVDKQLEGG